MSDTSDIVSFFIAGDGFSGINGPWQDIMPKSAALNYPYAIYKILPSSGRVRRSFGSTFYENMDVRFEVYDLSDTLVKQHQMNLENLFDAAKGNLTLNRGKLGDCIRTGSFTSLAGKDRNQAVVYVATCMYRLDIQRN